MTQLRRYVSTATATKLAAGISNTDLSLTVLNNSGYPVAPFTIKIENESLLVTDTAGNVFTIERGYDDTTPVAHAINADVYHVAIGDDFRNRWLDVTVDRTWALYDDEFDEDTIDAAWVEVLPSGAATWTQSNGVMSVAGYGQTSSDLAVLVKPFPVLPPQTVTTAVRMAGVRDNYTMVGLVFTDGTTTGSNAVSAFLYGNVTTGLFYADQRSGTVTSMGSNVTSIPLHMIGPWLHIRLKWTAINSFSTEWSPDGVSWTALGMSTISTTFTPTHAGLCFSTWGSANTKIGTYEYLRTEEA